MSSGCGRHCTPSSSVHCGFAAPSRCSGRGRHWTSCSVLHCVQFRSNLWAIPSGAASPSSSLRYGEALAEAEGCTAARPMGSPPPRDARVVVVTGLRAACCTASSSARTCGLSPPGPPALLLRFATAKGWRKRRDALRLAFLARRSLAVLGPWFSVDSVQRAGLRPLRVEPVGYPLRGRQPFFFASLRRRAGGSGGIRTPGRLPYGGFQNRCLRPLGHASARGNGGSWGEGQGEAGAGGFELGGETPAWSLEAAERRGSCRVALRSATTTETARRKRAGRSGDERRRGVSRI